jgi:hypothetical protein
VSPLDAAGAEYERERAARIRENMERMQKLGILDLAQTLNNSASAAAAGSSGGGTGRGRWRRKPVEPGSAPKVKPTPPPPARRSLRYGSNRLLELLDMIPRFDISVARGFLGCGVLQCGCKICSFYAVLCLLEAVA